MKSSGSHISSIRVPVNTPVSLLRAKALSWVSAISVIVLAGLGLWCFLSQDSRPEMTRFIMWYSSIVAALVIPTAAYKQCRRLLCESREIVEQRLEKRNEDIGEKLLANVRPRMDFCEGLNAVCRIAADVIREAHKQKEHDEYRYITFYGAAHLAVPEAEPEQYGTTGGSGQQSPYQQYTGVLEAATGDKVRMRRYIRLFTREEFQKRSAAIQREYLGWLKSQYNMLSRNPHYILGDIVRAPQWGGNLARIITHYAMMEITGNGSLAVVITDDHLCETVRRHARETVIGDEMARNKPVYYGQSKECHKSLAAFKDYILEIERATSTRGTGEEF